MLATGPLFFSGTTGEGIFGEQPLVIQKASPCTCPPLSIDKLKWVSGEQHNCTRIVDRLKFWWLFPKTPPASLLLEKSSNSFSSSRKKRGKKRSNLPAPAAPATLQGGRHTTRRHACASTAKHRHRQWPASGSAGCAQAGDRILLVPNSQIDRPGPCHCVSRASGGYVRLGQSWQAAAPTGGTPRPQLPASQSPQRQRQCPRRRSPKAAKGYSAIF